MKRQAGFTLIELMIVVAIIAIIAAIAVPSLLKARIAGNEASGISSLRTLTTVNEQYRTRFQAYSDTLANLEAAGFIDSVLSSGTKSGYDFTYTGGTDTWNCTGDPSTPGTTGDRFFFVDQTGVVRFSQTATATAADEPIK
jgi:type IV pilus assembly protein PilA